ncbi:MAG: rhodanese-like domain-containing protein [Thermodesulfobacteriota bacterium]|nr:rhodanese-like domain-containing protein [Thermodesulfobacteriota bacterium]
MEKKELWFLFIILMFFFFSIVNGCGESIDTKVNRYPNKSLLFSADSVEASIGDTDTVIIDARSSGYSSSHIPGAISMLWSDYTDTDFNLKSVSDLEIQLSEAGIRRNMRFIIYDDTTESWGAAGRIFWMLEYLGCTDVHLLNGGWDRWIADGRLTETGTNTLPIDIFKAQLKEDVLADKAHILDRRADEDFVIIDPREDEEYNGWILYGEMRGGHIQGALSMNYTLFFNSDKTVLGYEDLKDLLESRGITRDKEVSSYCTAGIRSGFVYFVLRLMGYGQCSNYDGSIYEWSADPACPMDMLPNYQKLVYPGWVEELITGSNPGTEGSPATYPGKGYTIIEVSETSENYDTGHIPGAINAYFAIFNGDNKSLLPDIELQGAIENLGITYDSTVILYGRSAPAVGRFAWTLMYAGVEDVRILNGGYNAWIKNNGAKETTENASVSVPFKRDVPGHPEYLATMSDVQKALQSGDIMLFDIRTFQEYTDGHIPGGILMDWNDWLDTDGTFRSYIEVEQMWSDFGIHRDDKIIFY